MAFELLRMDGMRQGSSGAQAGFRVGDLITAADGQVFPSVAVFAAYAGSVPARQFCSAAWLFLPPNKQTERNRSGAGNVEIASATLCVNEQ